MFVALLCAVCFATQLTLTFSRSVDAPSLLITPILSERIALENTQSKEYEDWRRNAIEKLWTERKNMGRTPLVKRSPPGFPNADIFFKNETATKTETLKHRFVWALMLYSIVEGKVAVNQTVYDSTSGNTGSSEAYMCTLVGLDYVAVVAKELEEEKVRQITSFGGKILKVDVSLRNKIAEESALKNNGFFINQFANADRAEEFHESGDFKFESSNVFHEILAQLNDDLKQTQKVPHYFVHSAGTGGTISSVGRYIIRYGLPTRVVLSDSEHSLFYDYVIHNMFTNQSGNALWVPPGIAGIGYGYNVKPVIYGDTTSLVRSVVHEAMKMPDIASTAAAHVLRYDLDVPGGPSTALNFLVALYKAYQHKDDKSTERLTITTIVGDPAKFYDSTYFNATWVEQKFAADGGMKGLNCWKAAILKSYNTGSNFLLDGLRSCHQN